VARRTVHRRSLAANVERGRLVGRRLEDIAVVLGLDELAPVGRRARPDTFPTLEMRPYPLPRILFTTPFVHGFPVRVGSPSVFKTSQTC
jgi:hypothetical protein